MVPAPSKANSFTSTQHIAQILGSQHDNHELGIADYYKYFPKDITEPDNSYETIPDIESGEDGKKVWL